jgi:hypothetical protein
MTHGGATGADSAAPYGPARRSHSSSSTVSTPSSRALVSFNPAPGPPTTRSVLAEIEPDALAPNRSASALASSRVIRSSDPVKTDDLRAYVGASSCPHGWIPAFAGMTGVSATLDASSRKFYR